MAKRTPSSAGASYGQWDAVNGIDNISDAWSRYKATQISTPSAQARKFFTTAYKRAQTRYSPTMGRFKGNPKRKRTTRANSSSPLLPAKVRINPRTGKVQVFVSPKVAAQVKGNRRNNPRTFKDVRIGEVFYFAPGKWGDSYSRGPFVKNGPRKYTEDRGDGKIIQHKIGSVSAKVQ